MSRIFSTLVLAISVLVGSGSVGFGQTCDELKEFEAYIKKSLPTFIDEVTEIIDVKVDCSSKLIEYKRKFYGLEKNLEAGWRKRKQEQYLQLQCDESGLSQNGWIVKDYTFDARMNLLVTLEVFPYQCN